MARRKDRFMLLALKAAAEAMAMSGLDYENGLIPPVGTVGAGIGGLATVEADKNAFWSVGPPGHPVPDSTDDRGQCSERCLHRLRRQGPQLQHHHCLCDGHPLPGCRLPAHQAG